MSPDGSAFRLYYTRIRPEGPRQRLALLRPAAMSLSRAVGRQADARDHTYKAPANKAHHGPIWSGREDHALNWNNDRAHALYWYCLGTRVYQFPENDYLYGPIWKHHRNDRVPL